MSFLPFPPHVSPSTAAPYGYSHPPRRSASLPAAPCWPWAVASCSRLCSDPNPHGPTAPRNFQSLDAVATQEEPVQCKIDTKLPVVSWVKILNSTYRMEIGSYWTTIQVDHQGVSGWNALTWWSTFGLRGLGISDPTSKRKTYPSTNPATPPLHIQFGWFLPPKSEFFKLPKNCLKNVSRNIQRDPLFPEPLNLSIYKK